VNRRAEFVVTEWGLRMFVQNSHTKSVVFREGDGGRNCPIMDAVGKKSFPFARRITSGLAGVFLQEQKLFEHFFSVSNLLFILFHCFQLCTLL